MKKALLCMAAVLLAGVSVLSASPVLGPPVGQCSAAAGVTGSANDLIVPFSTFSVSGFACEQQDKIYSNFNMGAIPTDATLRLQVQPLGALDFHTVTFNGNFLADFTVSYDVAIDLTLSPTELITSVSGDISNPSNTGTPSNLKTVFSEAGVTIGSLTSVPGNPGNPITTAETALHVSDQYTAAGGAVVSISNTFREEVPAAVPEPLTYLLAGGGFLLLASLRRIRRV
ncbi:MAG: hypothetical protein LAP87_00350 [Acidobacteriia bacterium]|nr:hypothetical protein [Terriglobia bacterium]